MGCVFFGRSCVGVFCEFHAPFLDLNGINRSKGSLLHKLIPKARAQTSSLPPPGPTNSQRHKRSTKTLLIGNIGYSRGMRRNAHGYSEGPPTPGGSSPGAVNHVALLNLPKSPITH